MNTTKAITNRMWTRPPAISKANPSIHTSNRIPIIVQIIYIHTPLYFITYPYIQKVNYLDTVARKLFVCFGEVNSNNWA